MRFRLDDWKIDLGQTPIENMFLNLYMPQADGDAVKAYLYGYKCAWERDGEVDPDAIAQALGLSAQELETIWAYWERLGLVEVRDGEVLFFSLRQLYLGVEPVEEFVAEPPQPTVAASEPSAKPDYEAEPKQLVEAAREPAVEQLITQIESIAEAKLRPNQVTKLLTQLRDYPVELAVVAMSFSYSFYTLQMRDFDYALGVWAKWYIAGVRTGEQLDAHLKKEAEKEEKRRNKTAKKGVRETGFSTKAQGQDRLSEDELQRLVAEKLKRQRKK